MQIASPQAINKSTQPKFSATYLVAGIEKDLERFRSQLRSAMTKKGYEYSTASVYEADEKGKDKRALMVFTHTDAQTLKEAFKPQRLYNMELSQYNKQHKTFTEGLEAIYKTLINEKSRMIKENLGGDFYKSYADFIDGLYQTTKGNKAAMAEEIKRFEKNFKPDAPESWKEFLNEHVPQLKRISAKDALATKKESSEDGFDFREGEFFNKEVAAAEKQALISQFSDKLDGVLTQLKKAEEDQKKPLLEDMANGLNALLKNRDDASRG